MYLYDAHNQDLRRPDVKTWCAIVNRELCPPRFSDTRPAIMTTIKFCILLPSALPIMLNFAKNHIYAPHRHAHKDFHDPHPQQQAAAPHSHINVRLKFGSWPTAETIAPAGQESQKRGSSTSCRHAKMKQAPLVANRLGGLSPATFRGTDVHI